MIRRMLSFARRHGSDTALGGLFLAALALGAPSAISGLRVIAQPLLPGEAMAEPQSRDSARLALFGFGAEPAPYTPQVLFPTKSHALPAWLRMRLASGVHMPSSPQAAPGSGPVMAICIDDLGEDLAGTDKAIALPRNVTLSFLPFAESTPFLATEAERKGHQVLAHVPMEAVGKTDPGPMSLAVGSPDIAWRLAWNIDHVPGLSGINNHEGSKFSTDAASLVPVMETLAARHLFYFDSRTIAGSQGIRVAHMFGVMSGGRDIFLDDTISEAEVRQQLADLVTQARKTGVAIAIGHPHEVTLRILAAWLAQDHGIRLVPVSEAIKLKTEHTAVIAAE
ncbi:MAG TPA: divergent polysaccharide deacetylase family protein [Rhizomicrobium sp.]|nr:divergent polysaccharide deacetylase family protein [Rhizomicrobium sp.]